MKIDVVEIASREQWQVSTTVRANGEASSVGGIVPIGASEEEIRREVAESLEFEIEHNPHFYADEVVSEMKRAATALRRGE